MKRKIGVVTSGGDAPGMNAAIRAIVRRAVPKNLEVLGFKRGYAGLLNNEVMPLGLRTVGGIIHLGGTILRTERCPEFATGEGIEKASEILKNHRIEALLVIGGDGSFKGALELHRVSGIQVIGIPATIDNDVAGTDTTIGFDTAVNTAVQAIDRIRDTAMSHGRVFVIEVMGRKRGFLALEVGLTAGAEVILVPEIERDIDSICRTLIRSRKKEKEYSIVVVAEGFGDSAKIRDMINKRTGFETRLTILGHIQRGGSPTARSRLIASLFGSYAVDKVLESDESGVVGLQDEKIVFNDLEQVIKEEKPLNTELLRLAEELAI
ncbi:MAG TPA: 6-phosphofructokinase [Candidatus Bathyarchaeota archaeon]|nr:6-phosphofructokinase [Candidatus Bathyarchaeota archaeon]